MNCAKCNQKDCAKGKDCTQDGSRIEAKYSGEILQVARAASFIEATYYMKKTRLEELIEFAKVMGYKRIGIAFCIGLSNEAQILNQILDKDFEVHSVCCKVCGIPKARLGFKPISNDREEPICNPVGQAELLNKANTDLNVIVGLCIGHDIIFASNSKAPVTTLVVKDRVLAHNPCGAIYSGYHLRKILRSQP